MKPDNSSNRSYATLSISVPLFCPSEFWLSI